MDFKYLLLFLGIFTNVMDIVAQGTATVKLKLVSFDSRGRDSNGNDCDVWPAGDCDPEFKFCLDRHLGSSSMNTCPLFKESTDDHFENDNSFHFKSRIKGVDNPIVVPNVNDYTGIRFKVNVDDVDPTNDDHIDSFDWSYEAQPARSMNLSVETAFSIEGQRSNRPARLSFTIRVYCNAHSYGDDCSTYCMSVHEDGVGHYGCNPNTGERYCLAGWEDLDTDCLIVEDNCEGVTCHSGGVCRDLYDNFTCDCPLGYTGNLCETNIDECESNPCQNEGTCSDTVNGYSCECDNEYTGSNCELHVCDEPGTCQNGGTCAVQSDGTITCVCPPSYAGIHCDVNACEVLSCTNGDCEDGVCVCDSNFIGGLCDVRLCDIISCQSGGTCLDDGSCDCPSGYTGQYCEERQASPCRNQPCHNDAQCVTNNDDNGADFECNCQPGFKGTFCDEFVSEQTDVQPQKVENAEDDSMPQWAIILVALLVVAILLLIVAIFVFLRRRRSKLRDSAPPPSYPVTNGHHNSSYAMDERFEDSYSRTNTRNNGVEASGQQADPNEYELPAKTPH